MKERTAGKGCSLSINSLNRVRWLSKALPLRPLYSATRAFYMRVCFDVLKEIRNVPKDIEKEFTRLCHVVDEVSFDSTPSLNEYLSLSRFLENCSAGLCQHMQRLKDICFAMPDDALGTVVGEHSTLELPQFVHNMTVRRFKQLTRRHYRISGLTQYSYVKLMEFLKYNFPGPLEFLPSLVRTRDDTREQWLILMYFQFSSRYIKIPNCSR